MSADDLRDDAQRTSDFVVLFDKVGCTPTIVVGPATDFPRQAWELGGIPHAQQAAALPLMVATAVRFVDGSWHPYFKNRGLLLTFEEALAMCERYAEVRESEASRCLLLAEKVREKADRLRSEFGQSGATEEAEGA